jgi:hypothetical protein
MSNGFGVFLTFLLMVAVIAGAGYLFNEREQLIQANKELENQLTEAQSRLSASATKVDELMKSAQELTEKNNALTEQVRQAENMLQEERSNKDSVLAENEQLKNGLGASRQQLEDTLKQLEQALVERDAALQQVQTFSTQPKTLPLAQEDNSLQTFGLSAQNSIPVIIGLMVGVVSVSGSAFLSRRSAQQRKNQPMIYTRQSLEPSKKNRIVTMSPSTYQQFERYLKSR